MAKEQLETTPGGIEQGQEWRIRLIRMVFLTSLIAAVFVLALFLILWILDPRPVALYMVVVAAVFIVLDGISFWLARRQRLNAAVGVYLADLIIGLTVAIYLINGITGPMAIGLVMAVVIAGLVGDVRSLRLVALIAGGIYLLMAFLEATQVLRPIQVFEAAGWWVEGGMFLAVFTVTALVIGVSTTQTQSAISTAQQRGEALVESSRLAQAAAQSEREAREREAHSVAHLRETIAGYAEFLAHVSAGDHEARVDVGELDETVEGDRELHALGEYLNSTVESLIAALTEMQAVQRRYTAQSWQAFAQPGRAQQGFRYRQDQLAPADDAWMPEMQQAAIDGAVVASKDNVAVPLIVNRQVIGAIGGRHPGGRPWTDEELALISDVTGQLAQTVESLRLFDETQRNATRERLIGQVTGRVRESLDMEAMLRSATSEIRSAMGLDKVAVRLVDQDRVPDKPTEA